ncbi:MAG TPA: hypothetical protein VLX90_07075 [Steroidobacteraceae bacterium]|nr:hypothetical protein [Steroidobacteraceae bacterium]
MTGAQARRVSASESGGGIIEVELNPEQVLGHLPSRVSPPAQQSAAVSPAALTLASAGSGSSTTRSAGRTSPMLGWAVAGSVAVLLGAWAVALYRPTPPEVPPPPPVVQTPALPPPAPAPQPAPQEPPVQFRNPFDRSEVFEFPPGTSRAEARQAVAEVLMQRARDRGIHLKGPRFARNTVAANRPDNAPANSHSARAGR